MDISKDKLLWMYERMQLIRTFENRVKVEFGKGKIPGFVHLYAGKKRSRSASAPILPMPIT